MTNKRAWVVGILASLGLVTVTAGILDWYVNSVWEETDTGYYRGVEALTVVGCAILLAAWAVARKR